MHPLRGVLAQLLGARARGVKRAVVPRENAAEAALVEGIDVRVAGSLRELVDALNGRIELAVAAAQRPPSPAASVLSDDLPTCAARERRDGRSRSRRPAVTTF